MKDYFVTTIPDRRGFRRLHTKDCYRCRLEKERIYLGSFDTCEEALEKAQLYYSKVAYCPFCMRHCVPAIKPPYIPPEELFK